MTHYMYVMVIIAINCTGLQMYINYRERVWCLECSPGQSENISKHRPRLHLKPATCCHPGSTVVQRSRSTAAVLYDAGGGKVSGPLHHGHTSVQESSEEVGTGWPL